MPSDEFVKNIKKVERLAEKAKPKPVYSGDPKKARLERKMDAIGKRIKHGKG